jgi:hypothetical protein
MVHGTKKTGLIWHPILFAFFPTLSLYSRNQADYPIQVIFIPLIVTAVAAAGLWLLAKLLLRNSAKAALIVSLFLVLFFSYGHAYNLTWYFFLVKPFHFGAHAILLPLIAALLLAGVYFIMRTRRNLSGLTRLANSVSVILVGVSAIAILVGAVGRAGPAAHHPSASENSVGAPLDGPDIYYIILDGFAREDVLRDIYQYPRSVLYDYLRRKGFYVARQSASNYCQTLLSLSSSLNMDYLDPTIDGYDPNSDDRAAPGWMMANNRASERLRELGYTTVAFATGYSATELHNADVFLRPGGIVWLLDEFQNGLLNTTPIPCILPDNWHIPFLGGGLGARQANARREMILRTFELLAEMPHRKSPKFVFAHLITPHPPFLFHANGAAFNPRGVFDLSDGNALVGKYIPSAADYIQMYRDQLQFIERKTINMIDTILANSARPPIIVLQADHGPGALLDWNSSENTNMRERLGILNAYYLPDGGETMLYETITPVNTFRAIFSYYFGDDYDLLPDESYYSMWNRPYLFVRVTGRVQGRR